MPCLPNTVGDSMNSQVCCSILSWNGQAFPGSGTGEGMLSYMLHTHSPTAPHALPVHRKLMVGTRSVISAFYSARDNEAICKICGLLVVVEMEEKEEKEEMI